MTTIRLTNYVEWQANSLYNDFFAGSASKRILRSIWSGLTKRQFTLTSYDEYISRFTVRSRYAAGLQMVNLDQISGSVSRADEFTTDFRPIRHHTRERWLAIARLQIKGRAIPPVKLYAVNGRYFVIDGHHRISVARASGQMEIEAQVVGLKVLECDQSLSVAFA